MNVTVPDGLTWNKGFDDLTRRIKAASRFPARKAKRSATAAGSVSADPGTQSRISSRALARS